MQETWVQSLIWEDPLEKGMATHSSILAGEFHGQRSLAGFSPWGHKQLDRTEQLTHKVLENPLDCKIKPANPKGNRPWIFIGMTDAEALVLWPPDSKSRLIGKDPDAGKDWRRKEKGTTEEEMVGWHQGLNGHDLSKLQEIVKDREAWCAAVFGVSKSQTRLSDWTPTTKIKIHLTVDGTWQPHLAALLPCTENKGVSSKWWYLRFDEILAYDGLSSPLRAWAISGHTISVTSKGFPTTGSAGLCQVRVSSKIFSTYSFCPYSPPEKVGVEGLSCA